MVFKWNNFQKKFLWHSLLGVIFFYATVVHAQISPDYYESELRIGYVVKNYPTFPDLYGPAWMSSFRMGKKLNGSRAWHRYYRFPYLGLDFTTGNLSNQKVLGCLYGVSAEMMFSQKLTSSLYLGETLSMGLAWFNHPYDKNMNAENTLVGSRVTALPHASLGLEYYLSPYFSLLLRASTYHASNCHYQLPNLGINIPSASLAIRYHPKPAIINNTGNTKLTPYKKVLFNFRFGLGVNERGKSTGPTGGPKKIIYLGQVYLSKNFAPVNKVQAGFEMAYNTGTHDSISSSEFYTREQSLRSCQVVFFLGHEFLMGHFSLSTQGGIYLYNPFYKELARQNPHKDFKEELKTFFVARLGFQYYFRDIVLYNRNQLFAGIYVKTNFGQADFLDLGLGYTF